MKIQYEIFQKNVFTEELKCPWVFTYNYAEKIDVNHDKEWLCFHPLWELCWMNLYNVTFFSDVEFNISKNFHSLLYEMKENRMRNVNMNRFIQKLYTGGMT